MKGTRLAGAHGGPFAALAVLLLASCSPAPAVLLSPEVAGLRPEVESAVPKGTKVLLEDQAQGAKLMSKNVIRLTTTPGWNLPRGIGKPAALPADWAPSYSAAPALAALGLRRDGSWSSVPLLFDPLGKTSFTKDLSGPPPSGEWRDILAKSGPGTVLVAGSRPSFRQAAYFFESYTDRASGAEAAAWFSQSSSGSEAPQRKLAPVFASRAFAADSWRFRRDDLSMSYKPGRALAFLESYRDFEGANPPGARRFTPLTFARGRSYATAGIVLFAEFRGDSGASKAAGKIVAALDSQGFLKAAGMSGKWLAADRAAPEIDSAGALVRKVVEGADRFFPISDRLPDPLVEGSLLVDIQLALGRASGK